MRSKMNAEDSVIHLDFARFVKTMTQKYLRNTDGLNVIWYKKFNIGHKVAFSKIFAINNLINQLKGVEKINIISKKGKYNFDNIN